MPEQTRDIRDFARRVVQARAEQAPVADAKYSGEALSPLWNAATDFGEQHKLSDADRANAEAYITRARNEAEMFAAPKVFWLENNVPGYETIRKAFDRMSKGASPAPVDGGELSVRRR